VPCYRIGTESLGTVLPWHDYTIVEQPPARVVGREAPANPMQKEETQPDNAVNAFEEGRNHANMARASAGSLGQQLY